MRSSNKSVTRRPKSARKTSARPSRHHHAYSEIRERILAGKLVPHEPLSEYQLADELKVSRTPVREALKRLEHEGLVRFVPNRGAFVADVSIRDIVEIYELREQLESFAAGVAASEMPLADIEVLRRKLENAERLAAKGSVKEAFDSDIHLHKQLIQCTKNSRMTALLATLDDQVHRIRIISPSSLGRLEAMVREHREVLEYIGRRDCAGAQEAMRRHLRAARENAIRLMTDTRQY